MVFHTLVFFATNLDFVLLPLPLPTPNERFDNNLSYFIPANTRGIISSSLSMNNNSRNTSTCCFVLAMEVCWKQSAFPYKLSFFSTIKKKVWGQVQRRMSGRKRKKGPK